MTPRPRDWRMRPAAAINQDASSPAPIAALFANRFNCPVMRRPLLLRQTSNRSLSLAPDFAQLLSFFVNQDREKARKMVGVAAKSRQTCGFCHITTHGRPDREPAHQGELHEKAFGGCFDRNAGRFGAACGSCR
ncbi:hypothetical protein RHE_CH00943 [Rhizobium etli CFN 42]|uniref:Uncharacterized protein n=1 Tax=Rhizobium etli (strain ATCC 51251 / DSM 11541 / JCM 21823 / NBRC 15573 / CFN 42) TaxID=347834 RepID=Q2KBN2_RHIEC|nr:hypothetical protein RHE_CH00943 [Rhizobium etli CFN 42]